MQEKANEHRRLSVTGTTTGRHRPAQTRNDIMRRIELRQTDVDTVLSMWDEKIKRVCNDESCCVFRPSGGDNVFIKTHRHEHILQLGQVLERGGIAALVKEIEGIVSESIALESAVAIALDTVAIAPGVWASLPASEAERARQEEHTPTNKPDMSSSWSAPGPIPAIGADVVYIGEGGTGVPIRISVRGYWAADGFIGLFGVCSEGKAHWVFGADVVKIIGDGFIHAELCSIEGSTQSLQHQLLVLRKRLDYLDHLCGDDMFRLGCSRVNTGLLKATDGVDNAQAALKSLGGN